MSCQGKNNQSDKIIISERLRQLMDKFGYNSKKLAEISGISEVSISRYLNGHQLIDTPQIIRLAKCTGFDMNYLLGGKSKEELSRISGQSLISDKQILDILGILTSNRRISQTTYKLLNLRNNQEDKRPEDERIERRMNES